MGKPCQKIEKHSSRQPIDAQLFMVWACFRLNANRLLISIENKVDSDAYITILRDRVIDILYMHQPFQQADASAHTSLKATELSAKMVSQFWRNGHGNLLISIQKRIYGVF